MDSFICVHCKKRPRCSAAFFERVYCTVKVTFVLWEIPVVVDAVTMML